MEATVGQALKTPRMTADEYMLWEAEQPIRNEFVRGEVFAMSAAEQRHAVVVGNLFAALHAALAGTPCNVFVNDMKLRVEEADAYFYPDVMVCCSPSDTETLRKREPVLVVEVLSPSTAAYDRGDKFAAYRTLPPLREFALVDVPARRVDLYRRASEAAPWVLHATGADEPLVLASVDLTVAPAMLWAKVDVPTGTVG